VSVADADATAATIGSAGGSVVVPPMDLPGGNGRIAFCIDPAGGFFGLFQAGPNHFGAALVNELGTLVWNELGVHDPATVVPFYSAVFGWTFAPMDDSPNSYQLISLDGRVIAGVLTMDGHTMADVPTNWLPYFVVEHAQAAADRCTALGGGVVAPPFDTPMGPMAVLHDVTGAVFAIGALTQIDDPNSWPG